MREAVKWSIVYIALPLIFGVWVIASHGGQIGLEYYTGYLVEKSLSVDNLFVFMLLLAAFAVPRELQQRVLLIGVAGALVLAGLVLAPLACCIDIESDDEVTASEGLLFGQSGAAPLIGLGGAGIARLIWCGGRVGCVGSVGVVCWAAGGCACCGI